jgi:serralysin
LINGAGNLAGTGNAADNVIIGNDGSNILTGAAGADTLTGGPGLDTFVFAPNFGHDRIADYHPGEDILQFNQVFTNFGDLLAHTADDTSGNAVIAANANDTVMLDGITKAILQQHPSDFQFV